jgi:hypothetical protein
MRGLFLVILHLFNDMKFQILSQQKNRKTIVYNYIRSSGFNSQLFDSFIIWNKKMACLDMCFSFYMKIIENKNNNTPFYDSASIDELKDKKVDISEFLINIGSQYVPRVTFFLNLLTKATASHKNSHSKNYLIKRYK